MTLQYDVDEVAEIIRREGLEYALRSYISVDGIKDEKLKEMVKKFNSLAKEIEDYIGKKLNNPDWQW